MNEHSLIKKYFAPLAKDFPGSLNLTDDAAIISIPTGQELIVTKDAICEGIHFIGNEDPALIAKKLLRTNLSDLAAMGATPLCYFLSVSLPSLSEDYISRFTAGLAEDQKLFNIHLAGGDTTTNKTIATFSLTAHGLVPQGKALKRSGAKVGDALYVSGTLGDAALGLIKAKAGEDHPLVKRYQLPEPRLSLGEKLRGLATSCIDISDGLIADANHICKSSNVGAEIDFENLPLSDDVKKIIAAAPELESLIYSGGDDYELLFTLPASATPPEGTTRIGRIVAGKDVVLFKNGKVQVIDKKGYSH